MFTISCLKRWKRFWSVHKHEFTIYLQFISCSFTIRNNTYRYTMLLSDVENIDHMRQCLHKRWYIVLNVHKHRGRINILPTPKNVSDGLLGACNNCRITWNYISLIFGRTVTEKLVMTLHIFHAYTFRIFIRYSNYSAYLYIGRKNFLKKWKKEINRDKKR